MEFHSPFQRGQEIELLKGYPKKALDLVMGKEKLEKFGVESWEWLKNPFPPAKEDEATFDFALLALLTRLCCLPCLSCLSCLLCLFCLIYL